MSCDDCFKAALRGQEIRSQKLYAAVDGILELCLDSSEPLFKLDMLCKMMHDIMKKRISGLVNVVPTGEKAEAFTNALREAGGNRAQVARQMGVSIDTVRYWTGDIKLKKRPARVTID